MQQFLLVLIFIVTGGSVWAQKDKPVEYSSARHFIEKGDRGEVKIRKDMQKKELLQPPVSLPAAPALTKPLLQTKFKKTDL